MKIAARTGVLALAALLVACTDKELTLEGERQIPREAVIGGEAAGDAAATPLAAAPVAVAIALPGQTSGEWTQTGGNAAHSAGHAAWSGSLQPLWSARVGQGESRRNRMTAAPVVAGGRIFTMDAGAQVAATGTNGGVLWQTDLTPPGDRPTEAAGGGLAYADGRLFASTGFGEVLAIDPATGGIVWRQRLDTPAAGAPAAAGGKVFIAGRDGTAWAIDAADGRVAWQLPGVAAISATIIDGSAPAVSGGTVVFPFATGQLVAAQAEDGQPLWSGFVTGKRLGRAYAGFTDLSGDPVVSGGNVYAGSAAGRLGALSLADGAALWSAADGATDAVVAAGGSLFLVNDEGQLLRLNASSGDEVWRVDLPYFTKEKDRRRNTVFAHHGPVLAGGRIVTASTDGLIRAFDPASGALVGSAEIPGGAAAGPAVAGGVLYVLSKSGTLHAFR